MLKTHEMVVIALAVSAIWIVVLVFQSDTSAYVEICETSQTGQKDCAISHIIFVPLWHIQKFFHANEGMITALATIFIAAFTMTLWRSTNKLWNAGERQLTHLEDTSKRQLRAYVSVEPRGIDQYVGRSYLIGHIRIRNVGKIPARNVSIFSTIEHDQNGDLRTFNIGDSRQSETVLQPRATMEFGSYKGWGIPAVAKVRPNEILNVEGFLYVWGQVTYTDEFNTRGRTNFCHRYPCAMFGKEGVNPLSIHRKFARYHEEAGNDAI